MTRKVVKDPILKGQNRGEAEDLRAHKMGELERFRRDNGHDAPRETVNGTAQYVYRCLVCRNLKKGPKQPAYEIRLPCPNCKRSTTHEHEIQ